MKSAGIPDPPHGVRNLPFSFVHSASRSLMTAATLASPQQISQKIMSHDEALGMMEGLAIGDALGAYLEFSDRREASDYVREY